MVRSEEGVRVGGNLQKARTPSSRGWATWRSGAAASIEVNFAFQQIFKGGVKNVGKVMFGLEFGKK